MKKQEIVVLALRISSLALVFYALSRAAIMLPYLVDSAEPNIPLYALMIVGPIVIAIFSWLFAYPLAHTFLPTITNDQFEYEWNQRNIETTAFTIIGVCVLTYALPEAFYWFSVLYQMSSLNVQTGLQGLVPKMVATAIQLILGFWLLFGARGFCDFLIKIRAAGKNPPSNHAINRTE
jgi:hypothetical protein